MYRRITHTIISAAAAAAAAVTLGLPAAGASNPVPSAATRTDLPSRTYHLYGPTFAGREAGGTDEHWAFRYITAKVQVAQCQPANFVQTDAGVRLVGYTDKPYIAGIGISCYNSIQSPGPAYHWDYYTNAGNQIPLSGLSLAVGDWVRVTIYHSVYRDNFTVTNLTKATKATAHVDIPRSVHVWYPHATWWTQIMGNPTAEQTSLPAENTLLSRFRDCRVTSVEGVHRNLYGPWHNVAYYVTRNGDPSGQMVMAPNPPWGNGYNFNVWLWHR